MSATVPPLDPDRDEAELTALADSVIARLGQPTASDPFLRKAERTVFEGTEW